MRLGVDMHKTLFKPAVALLAAAMALALGSSSALAAGATGTKTPTVFALNASGYASRVDGGDLPVQSGKTALSVIDCTNQAGITKHNAAADVTLKGLATIKGAKTHTWTDDTDGTVSAYATHKIARVVLIDLAGLGTLELDGIVSEAHVYNDGSGYHAETDSSLGSITVTLLGIPTHFPVPPIGQTLEIPGLADISLGAGTTTVTDKGASAVNDAVKIYVIPLDTTLYLGHVHTQMNGNVRSALFTGYAAGIKASAVGGTLHVGKQPLVPMKCRGTNGQVKSQSIASVDLGALGSVNGLTASESAKATKTKATTYEEADVAGISLAGGALQITGIEGRANVTYQKGGDVEANTDGTQVAEVTLNGQQLDLPLGGSLHIDGIADLSSDVETTIQGGIQVIALQISLLDGSGATIDLGIARAQIKPSGL